MASLRIVGITLCLMASHAWGQETPSRGAGTQPATTTTEASSPAFPSPPIASYPLELLGLLAPSAQRGPVTLTPSIAVSEEYNDNIFLNNQTRQSDFITSFGPAITLFINRPSYQLNGGYSFAGNVYAREDRLTNLFDRQNFFVNGLYQVTPALTLTAVESFALNRSTNLVAPQGFSTGRQESWNNTFTPGLTWQMTPQDSLNLSATHSVLRFIGAGAGFDSDTYGLQSSLNHRFTPRLTGILGYGFAYVETKELETSITHTPTLGFSYLLTPTLTGTVTGGPAITEIGGDTIMSPAGTASLVQALQFGSVGAQYTRSVRVAGGFGGTTDTQTVSGTLTLSTLLRGLFVIVNPAYSVAESVSSQQTEQVDVQTITASLGVTYQIARYTSVFGGYTFLRQRTGGSSSTQVDVDQNQVRFGLQFGYPFNFD